MLGSLRSSRPGTCTCLLLPLKGAPCGGAFTPVANGHRWHLAVASIRCRWGHDHPVGGLTGKEWGSRLWMRSSGLDLSSCDPGPGETTRVVNNRDTDVAYHSCCYGVMDALHHRGHMGIDASRRTSAVHTGSGDPWPDSVGVEDRTRAAPPLNFKVKPLLRRCRTCSRTPGPGVAAGGCGAGCPGGSSRPSPARGSGPPAPPAACRG